MIKILKYDFKGMGYNSIVPIIAIIFISIYARMITDSMYPVMIFLERFAPVFASWWIIQSIYLYVEKETCEIFLSYSYSRIEFGVVRVSILLFAYTILIFLATCHLNIFNIYVWLQLTVQSFFYASLGFFLVIYLQNGLWSTAIIFIVFALNCLNEYFGSSIFGAQFYNIQPVTLYDITSPGIRILIVSTILLILAQYKLLKVQRRNGL